MRVRALTALTILAMSTLVVSCGGSSGLSGPLARVVDIASKASVTDVTFDAYIASLDLEKSYGARAGEIVDQLNRSRSAVNAGVKPIALAGLSGRRGAATTGATGVFMPLLYAQTLASAVDPLTSGRSSGGESRGDPLSSTTEGPTTTTTTFLNTIIQLSSAGPRVTLTMHWIYRETTKDKTSGQTLVDISDERTMVGWINVCPDAAGVAAASLDVHIQISGSGGSGGQSASTWTSSNTFSGHDDDSAVLRGVTQDAQQQASWQNGGGTGGYNSSANNFNWNAGESGLTGSLDSSGVKGSINPSGSATEAQATDEFAASIAIDREAVDPAYKQAQHLWRSGRCVVIAVPDYGAETPIEVSEQNKIQHDKEVDTGSLTKFGVRVRHRFGGALNQEVNASLSGDKKLEPSSLGSGSGSLAYTAPDQEDKQASATLKSVSKRGIGTLVLAFHTKGKHLTLSAKGTSTLTLTQLAQEPLALVVSFTIAPADFHKVNDTTWEATAQSKGTGAWVGLPVSDCPSAYSETGTITFVATRDSRAGKNVWVVHVDEGRSSSTVTGSTCAGAVTAPVAEGGYVVLGLKQIGDIVLPDEGGTLTLTGSSAGGPPLQVTITFTATVTTG